MDTSQIEALIYHNPRSLLLAVIAAFGVPWAVKNYRKFLALGKSGLTPLGPFGWIVALTLTAFGRETVSTAHGAAHARSLDGIVPHRQTDRMPSDEMAKRLEAVFEKHVAANPRLVQITLSPHEKTVPGMILHPDVPSPHQDAVQGLREIAHIHPIDHSMHVILSPADSKAVVELG
ncbi:hypothetical protein B0H14DRAFT_3602172 [Mycena olivaceomarginata]|nr:hypothetical protein B0H14DRAFT_3602172 [Mycena olivaceomarginata]